MTERALACVGFGAAVAVIALLIVVVPRVGHAGMLKCEEHYLDDLDEMQLRVAALKVLPKGVHLDVIAPCRNPGSARGFIATKRVVTPEGVQQWYEFVCRRMAQPWICDAPEFKQGIKLSMTLGGAAREVELSFEKGFSLERARFLASRAIGLYLDTGSRLPECETSLSKESAPISLPRQNLLSLNGDPVRISVEHLAGREAVVLEEVEVIIEFGTTLDDPSGSPSCWNDYIVVS
jgi:hypothetical protein